jgi:hypothetical protein
VKKRTLTSILTVFSVLAIMPLTAHAQDIYGMYGNCAFTYFDDQTDCWAAAEQCQSISDPTEKANCLYQSQTICPASANGNYSYCVDATSVFRGQLDYCFQAQQLEAICAGTFTGLDDWEAYESCRAASGIDSCQ